MTLSDREAKASLEMAETQERKHEWLAASKHYEDLLSSTPASPDSAEIWEKLGVCYTWASRQAEDHTDFGNLRLQSANAYAKAATLYEQRHSRADQARSAHCNALAKFGLSWLAMDPSEKREMLDESLRFGRTGLNAYETAGDKLNFGRICNDMLACILERLYVASDWKDMRDVAQEGKDIAYKAIVALATATDRGELLRAYFSASLHAWYVANFIEQEEKAMKELVEKSISCSQKALELSKEVNNPYYTAMSNWAAAYCTLVFTERADTALEYAERMLEQGKMIRDNYLKGIALYVLAFVTDWMMLREADPDKVKEGHQKIIKYAEDAIRCLQPISQDFYIAETYMFYAESYFSLARDVELTNEGRKTLLEKAVQVGRKGLDHAKRSGSPDATGSTLHALSKALHFYSNLETAKEEKVRLLEEALVYREEFDDLMKRAFPSNDWLSGVNRSYEGSIIADLSKVEESAEKKRALLQNAVSQMEDGVSSCKRWLLSRPVPSQIAAFAAFEDSFGGMLTELYTMTGDKKNLTRAQEAYEDVAKEFAKVGLPSRVAESYWKIAKAQDSLGEPLQAAESFERAFEEYKNAAQKIPNFAEFYLDYATYMRAWSGIERAILAHEHEKYAEAMNHCEKVASILKETRLWQYLSPNFVARSFLERGEDLSRKENGFESIDAFEKAVDLFKEAKEALEQETCKIQNVDEREKAAELAKASIQRRDYCLARISIEHARISDRKGDHTESAEKYDNAASMLERILTAVEREADRKEIEPIMWMCRAWQKMKMADGRVSSELYGEAAELFLKAKEHSPKDRTALLASGNSAFCRALEHGTRFEATRERDDLSKAKQYLSAAATYYLKAGFGNASVWTNATEFLFDAYSYMVVAELEDTPEKKMKTYLLAEKCLERSAGLYETAEYTGKREEVLKTLEKVREKREFALSLDELLTVPGEASSTRGISAPGLTVEAPVGLLKFERAFLQANLIARQREILIGENFGLEIQLVNLGKNPAFLTRLEEAVPEGFDLVEKPEKSAADRGFLNLKGRKLAPLETNEMKLLLKPRKKGKFTFTPKIQFMDESGDYKFCELEQVTVTVKELGIRGWLRGAG